VAAVVMARECVYSDDDVEALLNDVSTVGVDSIDNTDAAGDSSVVIVIIDPGVFGC
jgi:uncharacterized protein YejL (UPF0352 family)